MPNSWSIKTILGRSTSIVFFQNIISNLKVLNYVTFYPCNVKVQGHTCAHESHQERQEQHSHPEHGYRETDEEVDTDEQVGNRTCFFDIFGIKQRGLASKKILGYRNRFKLVNLFTGFLIPNLLKSYAMLHSSSFSHVNKVPILPHGSKFELWRVQVIWT